ncbi:MAG: GGDEF domain-containing protein, partial [Magnetococcales bacterium]|nr:GGDEF domain-containing protein [Magnetococcales bacterium]
DERMRLEWRRAHRNNSTLAIIMADVDHFKRFNDTYGHQAGDDCLKTVAESLQAALQRPADFLARYGGEEFVCILPETTPQGAQVIAERMCSLIAEKNLPHSTSPTASHVTVSVGVACCLPDSCPGSPEELLMLADECLYRAKREGRNRVITIQTPA